MNLDIIEYLNSNGIIVGEENFPRIKNKKKRMECKKSNFTNNRSTKNFERKKIIYNS